MEATPIVDVTPTPDVVGDLTTFIIAELIRILTEILAGLSGFGLFA